MHACARTTERPLLEVGDLFRAYGARYRSRYKVSIKQHRVMEAISRCRSASLGAHVDRCSQCAYEQISYNSCGDRHCPKCEGPRRQRWVAARLEQLLPIEYFHVVFTLPARLNDLVRHNERLCYDLLFQSASQTLQAFAARHWKGRLGITMVLHSWGQNLSYHPHVHCLVSGGALSFDGARWQGAPSGYLFPVKALAQVFRGKYRAALERAHRRGELVHPTPSLIKAQGFSCWLRDRQQWIVYAKAPFAGPASVVRYLGRYTHRVAISNRRLLTCEADQVSFRWKDYRDGQHKVMTLPVLEFMRRFLHHVLPQGFVRIRHYGFHAAPALLAQCRQLLAEEVPVLEATVLERPCPRCGEGVLVFQYRLPGYVWDETKPP